jgi:tetratricopeptide (TPR) repeat protein
MFRCAAFRQVFESGSVFVFPSAFVSASLSVAASLRLSLAMAMTVTVLATSGCTSPPDASDTHRNAANAHFQANAFSEAAAEYETSLRLKPKQDLKIYEKAAFAHMKAGAYDKAAAVLKQTIDLRPDAAGKVETFRNIAGMYMQAAQNQEKAEEFFYQALMLDPKDEQSLTWLAEIAAQRGGARATKAEAVPEHLERALARYDQLIGLAPAAPNPYINKRIVLSKYLEYVMRQKQLAESDLASNKSDAALAASFQKKVDDHQTKLVELKAKLDEATKVLGALQKSAKSK